jgi:hypothetical protein
MKRYYILTLVIFAVALISLLIIRAWSKNYNFQEKIVKSNDIELSQKLRALFSKKKLLCFGRYALEVPVEAHLILGDASFPSTISVVDGGAETHKELVRQTIAKIMKNDETAEITQNSEGPVNNSWQIRYYEGEIEREYGLHFFKTFLSIDDLTYIFGSSVEKGEAEAAAAARERIRVASLRRRDPEEVPNEEGYCIDRGFLVSDSYRDQEMVSAGFYFPSFPDVSFSVQSNKNAYSDYPTDEFQKMKIEELPLLARIKQAQDAQGSSYPVRTVLREGQRAVQHWHGEESLFKHEDGTHDFEWAFVGTPKEVANPSEYNVHMYTKVAHNVVGAADKTLLSDKEAIALWDKLLSGLKFRAKVPGAPEGSYYFLPKQKLDTGIR